MTAVRALAPVRLDFAGAWTDVPPFADREGGLVVAAAIELFAEAEVRAGGTGFRLVAEDLGETETLSDPAELRAGGGLALLRAGLRLLPIGPCALRTRSDAPPGSGLGSSGALDVAIVAALTELRGAHLTPREIAELGFRLEAVEAGIPGGRQDQYCAALGGFNRLGFHGEAVDAAPLAIDPAFAAELERRMLLCYTGASRFSGSTISRVMAAYDRGDDGVVGALRGLRDVAERMTDALRLGDLAGVAALLTENWRYQVALDPVMRTAAMAKLEAAVRAAGVLGGKAAGSGAGGCMFFITGDDIAAAADAARSAGAQVLPVRWAWEGVRIC